MPPPCQGGVLTSRTTRLRFSQEAGAFYLMDRGVLLAGGDKSTQDKDLPKAKALAKDLKK